MFTLTSISSNVQQIFLCTKWSSELMEGIVEPKLLCQWQMMFTTYQAALFIYIYSIIL